MQIFLGQKIGLWYKYSKMLSTFAKYRAKASTPIPYFFFKITLLEKLVLEPPALRDGRSQCAVTRNIGIRRPSSQREVADIPLRRIL